MQLVSTLAEDTADLLRSGKAGPIVNGFGVHSMLPTYCRATSMPNSREFKLLISQTMKRRACDASLPVCQHCCITVRHDGCESGDIRVIGEGYYDAWRSRSIFPSYQFSQGP